MSIAYLNGDYLPLEEAKVSPLDRGFMFADGIYEIIPVYASCPFRLVEHLQRLAYSLGEVAINNPFTTDEWASICHTLIDLNGGGNLSLYLQVTRGTPLIRDHTFPHNETPPTVFAMVHAMTIPTASPQDNQGYRAITLADLRWARCDIKSIALLPNVLMRQQAANQNATEAILLKHSNAVEGAASNLFIVNDGVIITAPLGPEILGGITRDVIIELCQQLALTVEERSIPEAELRNADEIWITSSTREVVPIVMLDDKPVGQGKPGPFWQKVAIQYTQFRRQLCGLEPL